MDIVDVHTRHCCKECGGCKYGDPSCTVIAGGEKGQEGHCEYQEIHDTIELSKDDLRRLLTVAITGAAIRVRDQLDGKKPQFSTTKELVAFIMKMEGYE